MKRIVFADGRGGNNIPSSASKKAPVKKKTAQKQTGPPSGLSKPTIIKVPPAKDPNAPMEWDDAYKLALQYYEERKYNDAEKLFGKLESALECDTDTRYIDVLVYRASNLTLSRRFDESERVYGRLSNLLESMESEPQRYRDIPTAQKYAEILYNHATNLANWRDLDPETNRERLEKAEAIYIRSFTKNPDFATAIASGHVAISLQNYEKARLWYSFATNLASNADKKTEAETLLTDIVAKTAPVETTK